MSSHTKRRAKARLIRAAAKIEAIRMYACPIEWIQAQGGEDGAEVKPKRFTMTAYTGGLLQVDRYGPPVVVDLAGLKADSPMPILFAHEHTAVVGHADEVEIGESTIKQRGVISGAGPAANEVLASAKLGFPWRASIGARPDKLEFVGEGVSTKANGKTFKGPLYVARKATLGEVSFVAVAADGRTSVKVAAGAAKDQEYGTMEPFQAWVEAMGLVFVELRDDQKAKLRAKYDAEIQATAKKAGTGGGGDGPPRVEPPAFDLGAIELAHAKHGMAIEAKAVEFAPKLPAAKLTEIKAKGTATAIELKAKALNEQWPAPRLEAEHVKAIALYEVELIQASLPKGPAVHSSTRDVTGPVIEAALCTTLRMANREKQYQPQVLEAADRHFRGLGLQELIITAAAANGYQGNRYRLDDGNLREVMRYAFPPIHASFSTISLPGILGNVANKMLLDAFMSVESAWRTIAGIRSVRNFHSHTSYRLTGSMEYLQLGPDGEIKHGALGQDSMTIKAETYAKMFVLTRQHIINDDLGAFADLPRMLGRGAALKINDVFWSAFLNNAAFFTAARGNYFEGAATALSIDSLTTAEQLFLDQTDHDGKPLGVAPAVLLVPTAIRARGQQLMQSTEMRDTTASVKYPTSNPHAGKWTVASSAYLSNAKYTGYSTTAWYLVCDPATLSVIDVAFLNGVENPTVEQTDADFDTLGIQFRGYHDFGVALAEYRAGVKSKGAA